MAIRHYPPRPVVIVDDDQAWCNALKLSLRTELGVTNVRTINDSRLVIDAITNEMPALVILDITMPYLNGDQVLTQLKQKNPEVTVIMITGRSELELAVRCVKLGAYDYFIKTDDDERIFGGIRHVLEFLELQEQNQKLKEQFLSGTIKRPEVFAEFVTASPKMLSIFRYVEAIGNSPEPVLVVGETGTGKELIARAVHNICCHERPWVAVNVAGLDDTAFSDTLFGHVRGAFTGADKLRQGLVEKARGGVIFLDEIGDLQLESQVKLLRFIQEGEYYPLGSDQTKKTEVKLVCATNHELQDSMENGHFRKDLYYRLMAHQINLPPLRERPEDIPLLLNHYLEEVGRLIDKKPPRMSESIVGTLSKYRFPGNIRELRALLFDAVSTCKSGELSIDDFCLDLSGLNCHEQFADSPDYGSDTPSRFPQKLPTIKEEVTLLVEEALHRSDGNQVLAGKMLGITQSALSKRLKKSRDGSV